MSSVQHLREFIRERLTAAAQEIFTEVEKTIICYEEELDAQRRMMGINWKPDIKLHRVGSDLQKPHISTEEEMSAILQVCHNRRRSSHDQEEAEPKQIKEEDVDPEQLEVKPSVLGHPCNKEKEDESGLPLIEQWEDSELIKKEEDDTESPLINEGNKEPDFSVVQHEQQPPEHLPTGQDQKDLCRNQEGEQLVQKQIVALIATSTLQEDNLIKEPKLEELSCHISPVIESKDQEGSSFSVSGSQSHIDSKKRSFKCDICGRWYKHQANLKNHYRTHTGEWPFSCDLCSKGFPKISALKRHKKIHSGEEPFLCQSCGKSFTRIGDLNVHKRTHTGEKPFSCESCGKCFSRIGNLNVHKRTHTGEKPFSCQTCGKSFSHMCSLTIHKRIHTGEKPFSCQTCGQSFFQISSLITHERNHTGERPFLCKACGKTFTRIDHLNVHLKIHTRERSFSCNICGKCFKTSSNLNDHRRIHTGEKPYTCETCGKTFINVWKLNFHIKQKHLTVT